VKAGTDPLDPNSFPQDENKNGIDDKWEQQYAVTDSMADSDGDGLSNKIEYQMGTNPMSADSDNDTFTDAEEVLTYKTNPLDYNDPGTLDNVGVKITNFTEGQLVGDNTPLIEGTAPLESQVRIVLRNDYGHEKILGDTKVDENNVFMFQVDQPIRNGKYLIVARALEPVKKQIVESDPLHIVIDSTLGVIPPSPKKLADKDISEDVILKNLKIEIVDKQPVLKGVTEYGNKVTASWRSVVMTSALIADNVSGEFLIRSPKELPLGEHEVYVTAVRKKDGAQSDTIKLLFNVGVGFPQEELKAAAEEQQQGVINTATASLGQFVTKQGFLFWLIVVVVMGLAGGGAYYFMLGRKGKK
jgi:hypothetical protein